MKAIVTREFGNPLKLKLERVQDPRPAAREVLVRVTACGVCHHDLLHRSGRLPKAALPMILGHEVAGEIVEAGADGAGPSVGSAVVVYPRLFCDDCSACARGRQDLCNRSGYVGTTRDGGYAEYLTVPARNVVELPATVEPAHASLAACPIGTSVRALQGRGRLRLGQVALIIGAGGGLGLHQIQIVKALGASALAVTTNESKREMLLQAGADHVFVSDDGFGAAVWDYTGREGVDLVVENVVTGTFAESLRTLRPGGRAVVLGNIRVQPEELDPGLLIARRLSILGSGNCTLAELRTALALIADGKVTPYIGQRFAFEDASAAHERMERRQVLGRAVLSGWRRE